MYDEDKINDSLDFVEQIKMYETIDPVKVSELYSNGYPAKDTTFPGKRPVRDINYTVPDEYTDKTESTFKVIAGDVLYVIICMLVSVIIAFLTTRYIVHHTIVDGNSMNNTLMDGDCLIINKLSYVLHEPERFDIIVFKYSEDVNYIKRIIGVPGDTVQIIDGFIYINGRRLDDDIYGKELIEDPGNASVPIVVGDGQYFVMGDNRNSSSDSRKSDVGLIDSDRIDGKAVLRIYPFDSIGFIE